MGLCLTGAIPFILPHHPPPDRPKTKKTLLRASKIGAGNRNDNSFSKSCIKKLHTQFCRDARPERPASNKLTTKCKADA